MRGTHVETRAGREDRGDLASPASCPLARDKLKEARFFLSQFQRSKGAQPNSRFYASALVSASRSVTWVLQAELRPVLGSEFDEWWDQAKKPLAGYVRAFTLVRDARNAVLKKGNVIIQVAGERRYVDGPVSMIRIIENPAVPKGGNLQVTLREDAQAALNALEDDRVSRLSSDELDRLVDAKIAVLKDLSTKVQSLVELRDDWQYEVGLDDQPLSFVDFAAELTSYLDALGHLLDEADGRLVQRLL